MNNFTYSVPTTIHFGRDQITHLQEIAQSAKRVLLVYGGGSIKRSGLYNRVMELLTGAGIAVSELSGVEPNPRIESVRLGVDICRRDGAEAVLAVGGGSVIDCAKVVAAGVRYEGDPWDLVMDPKKILSSLPVYSVLTLSATGSEMDSFAVISDLEKREKRGTGSPFVRPVMSILDPEYTVSVSARQTAAGTADIMSHTLENYFTPIKGAYLQARMCEAVLKTLVQFGPVALDHPDDYNARANLMWASSLAINGLLSSGSKVAWCIHPMEHELSAFYDITHGEGLAILTPFWMDMALREDTAWRFAEYGRNVFSLSGEDDLAVGRAAIEATRAFFVTMGLPRRLRDVGIDGEYIDLMAEKAAKGCAGSFVPLSKEDIADIYRRAL